MADLGGRATYTPVHQYLALVIRRSQAGGVLTSIRAVEGRLDPASGAKLLQRDERTHVYRIDHALLEPLRRKAFALAAARPDLLRRGEPG